MATTTTLSPTKTPSGLFPKLLVGAFVFALGWGALLSYYSLPIVPQPPYLEMSKKSGKNDKHANLKAREKAAQEYDKIKAEYQERLKKPNKSAADKKAIGKLRKKLERLRKKKDFTGENHSQNKKGN